MEKVFEGWLLKIGDVILPNSFLLAGGWESTPNQRLELQAYRDAAVLLHRETASSCKTKIRINIRETNLNERRALNNVIGLAILPADDELQRRVRLTYWNDETLKYDDGVFYISDTDYAIDYVDEEKRDIEYAPFSLTFTEY